MIADGTLDDTSTRARLVRSSAVSAAAIAVLVFVGNQSLPEQTRNLLKMAAQMGQRFLTLTCKWHSASHVNTL